MTQTLFAAKTARKVLTLNSAPKQAPISLSCLRAACPVQSVTVSNPSLATSPLGVNLIRLRGSTPSSGTRRLTPAYTPASAKNTARHPCQRSTAVKKRLDGSGLSRVQGSNASIIIQGPPEYLPRVMLLYLNMTNFAPAVSNCENAACHATCK
jgi:hypothetical protein